jgi:hypothetical protein
MKGAILAVATLSAVWHFVYMAPDIRRYENPRDVNRSAEDAASQSAQPVRRTHADHCGLR